MSVLVYPVLCEYVGISVLCEYIDVSVLCEYVDVLCVDTKVVRVHLKHIMVVNAVPAHLKHIMVVTLYLLTLNT